ncbi:MULTISPECIES: hypothetical protein [unclassified Isoptericola]|uniref:hypothetical protein n=1 Tax=unclassified Isoptericola TaxID=2623355 RepID=UPI002712CEDD|nr:MULTISPECIES: hypothetical protein [unclassified Isoptericola]MDO8145048.1 hypothetical protein [Isoptericola sp. 178]MDO8148682.1 hypothetical protein [Isoptericola sp. b515]
MTRRLFWVGVGVTITVVVIQRGRRLVARYTPEAVAARAEDLGRDVSRRTGTFLETFRHEFSVARESREDELVAALLAEGQPHPDDVDVRARRGRHAAVDPEAATRADEDELGYSF